MNTQFLSHDEPAALAYEANQMSGYGYEDEALMIRRQPSFSAWIASTAATVIASLSGVLFSRDLPAALAYETTQNASAGFRFETGLVSAEAPRFSQRTGALHSGAAAIIAWDKALRAHKASRSATVRPVRSFNAR